MTSDERRRHIRTGRRLEVAVVHEGAAVRGVLVDPTSAGALIECERPLPRSLGLRMRACSPAWPQASIELVARVIWCDCHVARLRWVQAVCRDGVLPLVRFLASHVAVALGPASIETQPGGAGQVARYLFPTEPGAGVVRPHRSTRELRVTWVSADLALHPGRARRRGSRTLTVITNARPPAAGTLVRVGLPTPAGRRTVTGRVVQVRSGEGEDQFDVELQ